MKAINRSMGLVEWLLLITLSILWGGSFFFVGIAVDALGAVTIVAHFPTSDEKMTRARFAGIVIGFAVVVLMIGPDAPEGLGVNIFAQLAVLGAAVSYALAGVFGRRFRNLGSEALVTATGQVMASAVVFIPLAIIVERPWTFPMPELEAWGAIVGLALFSTALACILYFRILATAGAGNVLLVTFLIPISAILLGSTILGEKLEVKHFVGVGLIGLGLAAIDGRPLGFLCSRLIVNLVRGRIAPKRSLAPESAEVQEDYSI